MFPWTIYSQTIHDRLAAPELTWGIYPTIDVRLYPNIFRSDPHPENSLNIINAASSSKTPQIMPVIALVLADACRNSWSGPVAVYAFGPYLTAKGLLLERR